ncbi:MAG: glycine cleavage system protein H [Alphaproteobacteria bacterium]|nr:glycine cleavage system protein H [Alphaproteobacteria bacterium]
MKKFTRSHEWIDEKGQVGVSTHALDVLGDIVFVELPEEGAELSAGESIAVIESHKAASDIYAPVDGTVTTLNQDAVDAPEDITASDDLWLFTITPKDPDALDGLMDGEAYRQFIESKA